ncbi:MAG: AraC family transcriptional regulator [Mesorhizobium amorphae]|nr:MAG: AraC family transcriptional regulator [Mesorhizobium amorphae]
MLDHSSKSSSHDALGDMLRGLHLDSVDYGRCRFTAPWSFAFGAQDAAYFHFIAEGEAWLRPGTDPWMRLQTGDAVLLPRGTAHLLASEAKAVAQPFPRADCRAICPKVFDYCEDEGTSSKHGTLVFSGSMRFNLDTLHPLLQLMPCVMRTGELMVHEPAIPHLLEAMGKEVLLNRVGASVILARLADVLAAQIIRAWVEHGCGDATGWLAAVRNPEIGRVLAAIHESPERDWTVAELARLMGASRSSFADKFAAIVGETPARYVAQVRMHRARQWIREDRARIAEVAHRLGYDSEASFSRAFKRVIGTAPGRVRNAVAA